MRKAWAVWMSLGAIVGALCFALWTARAMNPGDVLRVERGEEPSATAAAPVGRAVEADSADSVSAGERTPTGARGGGAMEEAAVARGRELYDAQGCATCHSISGRGNPRTPLDGVGARRDAASLRAWTLGEGPATDSLSGSVRARKARYRELSSPAVDGLVAYLASLTEPG